MNTLSVEIRDRLTPLLQVVSALKILFSLTNHHKIKRNNFDTKTVMTVFLEFSSQNSRPLFSNCLVVTAQNN